MGKKKDTAGAEDNPKILKIPCTFEDYKLKKTTNEMIISFAIAETNIDLAKSLLNCVQEPYILLLYKMENKDDLDMVAGPTPLEDLSFEDL